FVVVANRSVFAKLTASQRRALRDAGRAAVAPAAARLRTEGRQGAGGLCGRGALDLVTATPAEIVRLRAAVRPVYVELERDPETRSFIRAIEAMKRRPFAAEPSRCPRKRARAKARAPANSAARETAATPLGGGWGGAVGLGGGV